MSERLPLPAELLRYRAGPIRVERDANAIVHRLLDLADRGNHLEAAEQAAELLRGSAGDVRLIAIYLAGTFAERGVVALPELLGCVSGMLGPRAPEPASGNKAIDSALEWLFRAIVDRLAFHTTQRDAVWTAWISETTPAVVEQILVRSNEILAIGQAGTEALQKLIRWLQGKLGPAVERARTAAAASVVVLAPEPAPAPPPRPARSWEDPDPDPDDDENGPSVQKTEASDSDDEFEDDDDEEFDEDDEDEDEELDEDDDEPERERFHRRPATAPTGLDALEGQSSIVMIDSPALAQLRDKLHGFEILLGRGDLDKAAVIARDIQAILDDFDPITFMPSLFARYAQLLHGAFDELETRWQDSERPSFRILVQFYRSNLDGFIDE